MTKPLSPAAQAVMDALKDEWVAKPDEMSFSAILAGLGAAALREAINQFQEGQGMISAADLYLIATELELTHAVDHARAVLDRWGRP